MMRIKRKGIAILATLLLLCISLAACGGQPAVNVSDAPPSPSSTETATPNPSPAGSASQGELPSLRSNITGQASVPMLTLNNGAQMPQLGLGKQIQRLESDSSESGRELLNETSRQAIAAALQAGYRHLDTAHGYYNERCVGQGIIDSGVPRKEIWLPSEYGEGVTMAAIDAMLDRLQMDYIGLIYVTE